MVFKDLCRIFSKEFNDSGIINGIINGNISGNISSLLCTAMCSNYKLYNRFHEFISKMKNC